MELLTSLAHPSGEIKLRHDINNSFFELIRDALSNKPIGVCLGPVYDTDPASAVLEPFIRSAQQSEWVVSDELDLAPYDILHEACIIRSAKSWCPIESTILDEWTRAGLVLEIATRHGIRYRGRGSIHVKWKLNGTVTGRFGTEPVKGRGWTFNPLSLSADDRMMITASDACRMVAVLDYRAMDLCSMISLVPGLADRYGNHPDLHQRTAEITGLSRAQAKQNLFVYAYGGVVDPHVLDVFGSKIPELAKWFRSMPHGEGARRIQSASAIAFRAGLSKALPLLIDRHIMPMFTVHDELVLDVSDVGHNLLAGVAKAMEDGASQRIGRSYSVRVSTGYTYEEAKNL